MTPLVVGSSSSITKPQPLAECVYCNLPVPGVRARAADDRPIYCCFGCRLAHRVTHEKGTEGEATWQLTLIGVAIFLSMNVMVFNWVLYGQEVFNPTGAVESKIATAGVTIFRYLSMLFCAVVVAILGWPIAQSGASALRYRQINTDVLLALGVLAAFVYSYVSVIRESGSVYFDTVCMILLLVTIGRSMEARARLTAGEALRSLERLVPKTASLLSEGEVVEIPTVQLKIGDVVIVRPGMRCPADGDIIDGQSVIDEQIITGESDPANKKVGDVAYAGSLNGDGTLQVRVGAVADGSTLQHIVDALAEARRGRGRHQRIADRVAAIFVPAVVLLAIATFVWSTKQWGWQSGIMRSLAVLLIACPCALGVATPMAIWVAMGRAAKSGIVIRSVEAFENLARVRCVLFDKTGTLTTGKARIESLRLASQPETDRLTVFARAAALAQSTTHHLATAICDQSASDHILPAAVTNVQTYPGLGVSAELAGGGVTIRLGSNAFMQAGGFSADAALADWIAEAQEAGASLTCVGWSGAIQGVFTFSEDLRKGAKSTLLYLRESGLELSVVTGDHQGHGKRMQSTLGVSVYAGLLPSDKTKHVEGITQSGRFVAMVGDGINDAPALATATVGIAMGCGADVSRESADACLMSNDLAAIPLLFDLSKATVKVIKQNLFWAFAYNVGGLGLAATGRLGPVSAAVAMIVSSLLVVANSMRLGRIPLGESMTTTDQTSDAKRLAIAG
jgi:heavy metal translocating P-type ATPase